NGHRLSGYDRVERCPEISTGDRDAIAGTAVVELASIHEPLLLVEEEKIRRALRVVLSSDFLRIVVENRELKSLLSRHFGQALRPIFRVGHRIVRTNRHDAHATVRVIVSNPSELPLHVLDERAMPADEHYQQPLRPGDIVTGNRFSRDDILELKIGSPAAELDHRGALSHAPLLQFSC